MDNIIKSLDEDSYRYTPSAMSQLSFLPMREPEASYIKKTNGRSSIIITPTEGKWSYGSIPRLVLLYVRTLIKRDDPHVDFQNMTVYLENSYSALCEATGIPKGGRGKKVMLESIENLARTSITLEHWGLDGSRGSVSFFVARGVNIKYGEDSQPSYIRFSPEMWALLNEKSVPVRMSIVKDVSNSALALDIYMWLAFRTNKSQPYGTKLSWKELNTQFEGDDYPVKEFKRRFKKALSKIQKVWPELKICLDEAGVTVYPSLSSIRSAGYANKTVTTAEKDIPNMGRVEKTGDTVLSSVGGTNDNTGFIYSLDTLSDISNPFGE